MPEGAATGESTGSHKADQIQRGEAIIPGSLTEERNVVVIASSSLGPSRGDRMELKRAGYQALTDDNNHNPATLFSDSQRTATVSSL